MSQRPHNGGDPRFLSVSLSLSRGVCSYEGERPRT